MKRRPPFSEYLFHSREREVAIIFIGRHGRQRAIDLQSHIKTTMYLPYGHVMSLYDWPLCEAYVYLTDTGISSQAFIRECATCLLGHGAQGLTYLSRSKTIQFRKRKST